MSGPRSLHVVSSLRLSAGGPTQSVTQLCEALNDKGAPAEIATLTFDDDLPWQGHTPIHHFQQGWPGKLHRSSGLHAFLARESARFDLVHVHGLWEWPGRYARLEAKRHGKPLVISPRGMIESWSLQQNPWSKRFAMAAWEKRNLHAAALFHATSLEEASSLRAQGLRQPIAVIPNGIAAPVPASKFEVEDVFTLLFLSRLHPKKGVRELLEAWGPLSRKYPNWNLVIAGPDEDGYGQEMIALAGRQGLSFPRIHFPGSLHGAAKWKQLAAAHLFILPSHSENFGNVVLEALSQETPVMTTHGTPWASLPAEGCGWWIALDQLAPELEAAMTLPAEQRERMGKRGRAWATGAFGWPSIADRMIAAYDGLLGHIHPTSDLEVPL
jgi:glycosyltransferase involved in cell wall biosynthesis